MDNVQPGQDLGPYRLIGQVGQGGMATVYRAYHAAMDRYVAIKLLPRQLADSPEYVGRFQQEARTIARLEHARILPVYDYGEANGLTYLVMRFLDAGTLKERMAAGPLTLAEVDRLFTQLAEALEYAHRQGVIHRDLKPSNAMIDQADNLFLTDFGIAKLLEGGARFTNTGAMMGTPAYMSPEQAQGDSADQRSDIYSLGIILYEMVTGRVPFEAETPLAVVLKQISAPLPLPSSVKAGLSPAIERVLLKALAKSPDDRYPTVTEFLAAWKLALAEAVTLQAAAPSTLEIKAAALAGPPSATHETTPPKPEPQPAPGPARRLPLGLIAGGLGVLIILVLAGVLLPRLFSTATPPAATNAPAVTAAANTAAPAAANTVSAPTLAAQSPAADAHWTSWTTANRVWKLALHGGQLYAAGPGGISLRDSKTGALVRRYTTADGLPNASVNAIWVDSDGTLWAGTDSGLGRLNPGASDWIVYDSADGLDADSVTAITRFDNRLVVGTRYSGHAGGGLNLFDGQKWQLAPGFPSVDGDPASGAQAVRNSITVLQVAGDRLWVGTEAGLAARNAQGAWRTFSTSDGLPSSQIRAIFVDHAGNLLVGTGNGVARLDGDKFVGTKQQGPQYSIYGIVQDTQGRYYFSGDGGIWRYDPANANWDQYSFDNGKLPVVYPTDALAGENGALYFGSDGEGPVFYDGQTFKAWRIENLPVMAWFQRILLAPGGHELWFVELYGSYPDRFDLTSKTWQPYRNSPCDCLPLAFDPQGELWGSNYDKGAVVVSADGQTRTVLNKAAGLPSNTVTAVAFDTVDGHFLLGTDAGLVHLDANKKVVEVFDTLNAGPISPNITALLTTANPPATWVGTPRGVSHLKPDFTWEHFIIGAPFQDSLSAITALAEGPDGVIWAAASGDGLYRYQAGQWRAFRPGESGAALPTTRLNSLTVAADGTLWIGTDQGAVHFDGQRWQLFNRASGLIDDHVYAIYLAPDGAIWFATGGGVSRYQP